MISKELEEKLLNVIQNYDEESLGTSTFTDYDDGPDDPIYMIDELDGIKMIEFDNDIIIIARELYYVSDKSNNYTKTLDNTTYCIFIYDRDKDKLIGKDLGRRDSWIEKDCDENIEIYNILNDSITKNKEDGQCIFVGDMDPENLKLIEKLVTLLKNKRTLKRKIEDKIEELNYLNNAEELEDIMNKQNYSVTELVQFVLQDLLENE